MKLGIRREYEPVKNRFVLLPHGCCLCRNFYWLELMWREWLFDGRFWICHNCSNEKPDPERFKSNI